MWYTYIQKQTQGYTKQTCGYPWGEGMGRGQDTPMKLRDTNYYI